MIIIDNEMLNMSGVEFCVEICCLYFNDEKVIIGIFVYDILYLLMCFLKLGVDDYLWKLFNNEEFYCWLS